MAEAEWIADRDDKISDFYEVRIADRYVDQVFGVDLEDGDVRCRIGAYDFCVQGVVIEE